MTTLSSNLGTFTKILLTTDGSKYIAGAEREAINFAKICGSKMCVMSVVLSSPEYDTLAPKLVEKAEQNAIDCMNLVIEKANKVGVEGYSILRHSEYIYPEIVTIAKEQNIDLIVVGRRGKKGLVKLLMGSRTAEVINHVHCSVLMVPRAAKIRGKHILLAVDGSIYSEIAATVTTKLAKCFDIQVTILSVVHHAENAEAAVARACEILQGIKTNSLIIHGKCAETIIETAKSIDSDLIVVGSHGHTGLKDFWLGSVSEQVISLAESAVLVVRT